MTIEYDPVAAGGTMTIQYNDQQPLQVQDLSIEDLAQLSSATGNAYVGFTAGSHGYLTLLLLPLA